MNDEIFISRCLEIAKNGNALTKPNPSVGAVIVCDDKIIGEGYTSPFGGDHAEINALQSVADKSQLKQSTLYVTLEPCSHFGKTPPCANAIIKFGIPRVVIGCLDPNPKVKGNGVSMLKQTGIDLKVGVLEHECREHHKSFLTQHELKRPYIILKWAQCKNGMIAPNIQQKRKPFWISNSYAKQLVHKWRSEEQAILVGTNTVLKDNPKLNTRLWKGNSPIRIILDSTLRLPLDSHIFDDSLKTIVIIDESTPVQIEKTLHKTHFERINFGNTIAEQISNVLFQYDIQSVIIEGGAQTLNTFIDEDLWDEARVTIGDVVIENGMTAPQLNKNPLQEIVMNNNIIRIYQND